MAAQRLRQPVEQLVHMMQDTIILESDRPEGKLSFSRNPPLNARRKRSVDSFIVVLCYIQYCDVILLLCF